MDKKRKLIWVIFIFSLIMGVSGFLRFVNFLDLGNRELWHFLCFFFGGTFLFSLNLLIGRKNLKLFIVNTIVFYFLLIFLSLEWEIPLKALSFLDISYSNSFSHLFCDFLGIISSIIFNLLFYFKFLKKEGEN